MLLPPHFVHGFVEVFGDVELVKDDLLFCLGNMLACGRYIRIPHIHCHGLDAVQLIGGQLFIKRFQSGLPPMARHTEPHDMTPTI